MPLPSVRRPAAFTAAAVVACSLALATPVAASAQVVPEPIVHSATDAALTLTPLGSFDTGVFDESAAEIVQAHGDRLFVVNAQAGSVGVLDYSDPTAIEKLFEITSAGVANSVAIRPDGLGVIAVEAIAGQHPHLMDKAKIPGCTYCNPQIASVGLTEKKAKEAGYDVRVGKFPFIGNGKAIALGEAEGFVKTVFDEATGELLGAHMVGAEVTELIQGYVVARQLETTEAELMQTIFAHPTLSEMMHESVLSAYGRALHF